MNPYSVYPDAVETERLVSRYIRLEDIQLWEKYIQQPTAIEFLPWAQKQSSLYVAQDWIQKQLDRYVENRFGLQLMIHKKTNQCVGQCGLLLQEIEGVNEVEIGYFTFPEFWGQGFATEAAQAFKKLAFDLYPVSSVISIIHQDNIKSQQVARKNGMTQGPFLVWREMPVHVHRITRDQYLAQSNAMENSGF